MAMTNDDIIRMAREANLTDGIELPHEIEAVERFAALVAAAEREKVARWQIGSGYTTGHGETIEDLLVELEWQVRESEREACAKVCADIGKEYNNEINKKLGLGYELQEVAFDCEAAIRARGQ